ncbi:hypothetical protein D9756_009828 [Leucocoprinus leucothites]|uniref:Heterokaryon incompatibility domain-containing protein n=1 Tax=Leucocoprinus leucothites TaxID=201217 RepID=A0A8H5CVL4_9AGAR|nr:hypothetical protein D9756_009828 [Leucoagaricus leucothites]
MSSPTPSRHPLASDFPESTQVGTLLNEFPGTETDSMIQKKPMTQAYKNKTVLDCLRVVAKECRVGRLFKEDPGVLAPLWFGRDPDSEWHVIANWIRVILAIPLAPIYVVWSYMAAPWKQAMNASVAWNVEWPHVPDAIIYEPPGAVLREPGWGLPLNGEYAVTNNKPRWLLEVHFRGTSILSEQQVPYDGSHPDEKILRPDELALRKAVQDLGYIAISYPMKSARHMFRNEAKRQFNTSSDAGRKLSLENRQLAAHIVLECYAEARASIPGKTDGVEYIWLDEFCLSDAQLPKATQDEKREINKQRGLEIGQLADIFRGAKQTVVFCHEPRCDHTDSECAWGKRLFTLGEIMYMEEVLQMTRRLGPSGKLVSSITILPGREFRGSMQARAAKEKQWHLYNIMQHSTNSGSVHWQSAIHSLVVEAIRRDEADGFHAHNMLGKALNGLLPRRSKLEDLQGVDGWADLAWLLELNQGYYNAAALAAVCQTADPWVGEYRWWGRPIRPQEGRERLEPLSTAIPAKFRDEARKTFRPVLSIIGPKSVKVKHMLRRDDSALFRNPEMRILKIYSIAIAGTLGFIGLFLLFNFKVALPIIYVACVSFTTLELLVGTIYVKKDGWIVYEDRLGDPISFLAARDFNYRNTTEWGDRQLIPKWDVPTKQLESAGEHIPRPYGVTLINLQTGVYTKAMVTGRPNNMVVLAVHGGGITCMLLQREEKALEANVSVKVGMVNVPPFVLSQADYSGTVYVGGGALCEKPWDGSLPGTVTRTDKTVDNHSFASPTISRSNQSETSKGQHESSTLLGSPMSPPSSVSLAPPPGTVSSLPSISLPQMSQTPSSSSAFIPITAHADLRRPVGNTLQIRQVNGNEAPTSNEDFNPYQAGNRGLSQV